MTNSDDSPKFSNADNRLLWQAIQGNTGSLSRIEGALREINGRLHSVESAQAVNDERWTTHRDQHKNVERDNIVASTVAGVISAIAAVFGGNALK